MSTYGYQFGADVVAESGHMRAFGERILVRAILKSDAYERDEAKGTGLYLAHVYNSSDAECFEVLAVGAAVEKWCAERGELAPKIGQHVDVRSTAADRVAASDPTSRYWLVPIAHVAAVWNPVDLSDEALVVALERAESLRAEKSIAIAAASARV